MFCAANIPVVFRDVSPALIMRLAVTYVVTKAHLEALFSIEQLDKQGSQGS